MKRNTWHLLVIAGVCARIACSNAQNLLVNGSFEFGSANWTYTGTLDITGPPNSPAVGVDGNYCVRLGGGNIPNSTLSQTFSVVPSTVYLVTLATAAYGGSAGAGMVSALRVDIVAPGSNVLASQQFTNVSPASSVGTNGFVKQAFEFVTPATVTDATLRITDISPNGGDNVDPQIDAISEVAPTKLIVNGSFELNGGSGSPTATAWTQSNGPLIGYNSNEGVTDGAFAAQFNPGSGLNGTILSQTFATVTGQSYFLTFDWGNYGANASQRLRVEVRDGLTSNQLMTAGSGAVTLAVGHSGVSIEQNINVFVISDSSGGTAVNAPAPNAEFSVFSLTFRAQSGSTTLSFTDQGTSGYDLGNSDGVLDNVRVVATADTSPTITTQPQSQAINPGDAATFSVTATGTSPLGYQWLFNGSNLTGQTGTNLILTGVTTNQAGGYSVVVSNVTGMITSAVSVLAVVTIPPPFTNRVLNLDGNDSYVSVPSSPDLQNSTEISIEAWIYPRNGTEVNNVYWINNGDGANVSSHRCYEWQWGPQNGQFSPQFFFGTNGWAYHIVPVAPSNWVHVAVTFNSAEGTFCTFTNGVCAASANLLRGFLLRQTSLPLYFGRNTYSGTAKASGFMDEIRIWNKARSQQEIQRDMSRRLTGAESNLVAYWTFDDGTANDQTGHGHNGTFSGNAGVPQVSGSDAVHVGSMQAHFLPLTLTTGRVPHLGFTGRLGLGYRVQTSSDLRAWADLIRLTNISDVLQDFLDPSATNVPQRFYRAVAP